MAGRTQLHSRQGLSTRGRGVAKLDLPSTFIARKSSDSNRKVRRIEGLRSTGGPDTDAASVHQHARTLRAVWRAGCDAEGLSLVVHPCPRHDFNVAGLLYFASYGAWVDRALWLWDQLTPRLRIRQRECALLGRADPGGAKRVRLMSADSDSTTIRWRLQLSTIADERPLAVTMLSADGCI